MSSVRKRTLPSGEIRWQVDYRDRDGRRRHRQFKRKANAESYETKVRAELAAGTHVADSVSVTIAEAGELWLARAVRENLEAGTMRQYRQHLKYHINPLIGSTKLSRLTTPAVEKFRDELVETRSRPMARAVLTSLKGVLKESRRQGLIGYDPAADTSVSQAKRYSAKVDIPEKDEIRAILAKSAELWPLTKIETTRSREQKIVPVCWRPYIVTAIFEGLRCSEMRGLRWSRVNFAANVIEIRERADFQNNMGPPKTAAGIRDVPMGPMVANTLKSWKLACPKTHLDLVFPTENGSIHSNSNIHKQCWGPIQRALGLVERVEGAGVEPVTRTRYTLHALRHAAASLFIEQGWIPKKIQTVMGHASIQITFDLYGHLFHDAESDNEAMAELEHRLLRPTA